MNLSTCSINLIFIDTSIYRQSEIRQFCIIFCFVIATYDCTPRHFTLLRTTSTNLLSIGKVIVFYSHVAWLSFSFNNYSYFATGVNFIIEFIFKCWCIIIFSTFTSKRVPKGVFRNCSSFIQNISVFTKDSNYYNT